MNVDCVEYTGITWEGGELPDYDEVEGILTDLQPNTTYYYQLHIANEAGERVIGSYDFTTAE